MRLLQNAADKVEGSEDEQQEQEYERDLVAFIEDDFLPEMVFHHSTARAALFQVISHLHELVKEGQALGTSSWTNALDALAVSSCAYLLSCKTRVVLNAQRVAIYRKHDDRSKEESALSDYRIALSIYDDATHNGIANSSLIRSRLESYMNGRTGGSKSVRCQQYAPPASRGHIVSGLHIGRLSWVCSGQPFARMRFRITDNFDRNVEFHNSTKYFPNLTVTPDKVRVAVNKRDRDEWAKTETIRHAIVKTNEWLPAWESLNQNSGTDS